jgi:hypothetical protein
MIRVVALGVEGIFRVSPKSFELERMKEHFDNSEADVDPSKFTSAHVVCGLLKLYLREVCSLRHIHTVQLLLLAVANSHGSMYATQWRLIL